jgi:trehalose/maltose hydrolase-like predicted phosphorylase
VIEIGSHRVSAARRLAALPTIVDRGFEAVVFDWDGTAVPDRAADATAVRDVIERLCAAGMEVVIVSGTHVGNVDGQLRARPGGPGRLHLCLNRGSEAFRVDEQGVELVHRREASPEEESALTRAAEATVAALAERGLRAEIVSQRLNRRKIDLIPEPEWHDPPKARIDELLAAVELRLHAAGLAGLREAVELAEAAARQTGLGAPKVTSDAKHVEIGLTDKADSARWLLDELWRRGIGPELVLVGGDEFGPLGGLPGSDSFLLVPEARGTVAISVGREPTGVPPDVHGLGGGPELFLRILEDQLERRLGGAVPSVGDDPNWTLTIAGVDPELERVHETLLCLADGRIGTSGSPVGSAAPARPRVLAAVYEGEGPETELLSCPVWTRLDGPLPVDAELLRRLDLHSGLLRQEVDDGRLEAVLFSSLAQPGVTALRAAGDSELVRSNAPLVSSLLVDRGDEDGVSWARAAVREGGVGGVAVAARERETRGGVERIAAYHLEPDRAPEPHAALPVLAEAETAGFECLLTEHRTAWARRWETADIRIEGDDVLQQAVRFALFHLMASVADSGEAAVGARGLSGPAYRGHVFWDTDVFVLPFLAATHPAAARAMLEYRLRRLPDALEAARALGRCGARIPWESARHGFDVTPSHALNHAGRIVPIRTGELEEHIVADIAWAASCYLDWTADAAFAAGPAQELFVETARYWASRIRVDRRGDAHIYGVIGPDEYHEPVDDNAFTNVMARWNLRRAALAGQARVADEERHTWLRLAEALVDGYDAETGVYEQFAGYLGLEPVLIAELAPRRPIAAELLLGAERVHGSQVLKQADVLMLHHMVPEETAPGSLVPNLAYYEPRTAHGSSLSPAIHAALFARVGRLDEAVETLRLASRLDLDDLTGSTAGGLHLATMGGVWQALVFGFAGARPRGHVLELDPRLPEQWSALELRLALRGSPVRIRIEPDTVDVAGDVPVRIAGLEGRSFRHRSGRWEVISK